MNGRMLFWFAFSLAMAITMALSFYGAWVSTAPMIRFVLSGIATITAMCSYITFRVGKENTRWLR